MIEETSKIDEGESRPYEDAMIVTENYKNAMHDEIGLLLVKIALISLTEDPTRSRKYVEQSLDFLQKKIRSRRNDEKQHFVELYSLLELIKQKNYAPERIDEGLKEIDILTVMKKEIVKRARDGYYRIYKRY